MRFQDLFHSPPGVLFAFPSRYWFTIGRLRVFSLGGWSPHIQTGFHVSRPTFRSLVPHVSFRIQGYHLLWPAFPCRFANSHAITRQAPAISLATTFAISVDVFSSSYLDVSVHSVRLVYLCIQYTIPLRVGFPIQKSPDQSLFASSPKLIAGYHVFLRLSSPRHPPHALSHLTL